ncbi:MAG TPA: HAD family phosphatase [Salinimicrobium sp.]|nr:HAD family phosphatase [Salinimicrobium sp.]
MIKTLLFDFGDVFLTLDKKATLREFKRLGVTDFSPEVFKFLQEYEKGKISSRTFIVQFKEWFPHISENQIIQAWNAILLDFPKPRMDFIKKLASEEKFKLILLSNTNDLHIDWVAKNIAFFEEFKGCFDAFYLSHEINFRKPDHNIFQFIIKKHNLEPNEVLFIDDTAENTKSAEKLGFKIWNINPEKEDVTQLFHLKKELF